MKIYLFLLLLFLGSLACSQQRPPTPAGSIYPYTPAQLKALEKWKLRNRVDREQRLSPRAIEMSTRQRMQSLFPQPLVRYRAGKDCQSEFDCAFP